MDLGLDIGLHSMASPGLWRNNDSVNVAAARKRCFELDADRRSRSTVCYAALAVGFSGGFGTCTSAVHVRTTSKSVNRFLSSCSIDSPFHTRSKNAPIVEAGVIIPAPLVPFKTFHFLCGVLVVFVGWNAEG